MKSSKNPYQNFLILMFYNICNKSAGVPSFSKGLIALRKRILRNTQRIMKLPCVIVLSLFSWTSLSLAMDQENPKGGSDQLSKCHSLPLQKRPDIPSKPSSAPTSPRPSPRYSPRLSSTSGHRKTMPRSPGQDSLEFFKKLTSSTQRMNSEIKDAYSKMKPADSGNKEILDIYRGYFYKQSQGETKDDLTITWRKIVTLDEFWSLPMTSYLKGNLNDIEKDNIEVVASSIVFLINFNGDYLTQPDKDFLIKKANECYDILFRHDPDDPNYRYEHIKYATLDSSLENNVEEIWKIFFDHRYDLLIHRENLTTDPEVLRLEKEESANWIIRLKKSYVEKIIEKKDILLQANAYYELSLISYIMKGGTIEKLLSLSPRNDDSFPKQGLRLSDKEKKALLKSEVANYGFKSMQIYSVQKSNAFKKWDADIAYIVLLMADGVLEEKDIPADVYRLNKSICYNILNYFPRTKIQFFSFEEQIKKLLLPLEYSNPHLEQIKKEFFFNTAPEIIVSSQNEKIKKKLLLELLEYSKDKELTTEKKGMLLQARAYYELSLVNYIMKGGTIGKLLSLPPRNDDSFQKQGLRLSDEEKEALLKSKVANYGFKSAEIYSVHQPNAFQKWNADIAYIALLMADDVLEKTKDIQEDDYCLNKNVCYNIINYFPQTKRKFFSFEDEIKKLILPLKYSTPHLEQIKKEFFFNTAPEIIISLQNEEIKKEFLLEFLKYFNGKNLPITAWNAWQKLPPYFHDVEQTNALKKAFETAQEEKSQFLKEMSTTILKLKKTSPMAKPNSLTDEQWEALNKRENRLLLTQLQWLSSVLTPNYGQYSSCELEEYKRAVFDYLGI